MRWAEFKQIIDLATNAYQAGSSRDKATPAYRLYMKESRKILGSYASSTSSKSEKEMYESAKRHADMANKSVRAFQEQMAREINFSYGQTHSLDAPPQEIHQVQDVPLPVVEEVEQGSHQTQDDPLFVLNNSESESESDSLGSIVRDEEEEEIEADIVIVGGGPIGYAQAMGFKKLNPNLKIVVLEKYPEFQRKHTLVMQAKYLKSLMRATDSINDPELQALLELLPHIRTNVLQEKFKAIAEREGVITKIETVNPETIQQQLSRFKPKLIIGADGTHSVVNQTLFPKGNQEKHEVDFAMQIRYEIDGDAEHSMDSTARFYQALARQGLIATEQIGRPSETTGKTPVTVQLIIPKEDYEKLTAATAKKPLRPFAHENRESAENEEPSLTFNEVPAHLQKYITSYFADKVRATNSASPRLGDIRISVNELPASRARQTVAHFDGVDVGLNGDSALGLSYFKGLNAGLEALAMFFTLLKPAIKQGLTDKKLLEKKMDEYQNWFSPYADKKVEEVKQYSTFKVRSGMKLIKVVQGFKNASHWHIEGDERPVIETYHRLLAKAGADERVAFIPYPHRSYDPNIRLGQFAYIPISYTLKKIAKLFIDYFKPYKGDYQFYDDFKQPFSGLNNTGMGIVKIIAGIFTLNIPRFGDGIFTLLRGVIELATTPLAWFVKPFTRGFVSFFFDEPKIEEGRGIQKLVELGEQLLSEQSDDDFSLVKMQNLLGVCNDLHRKYDKGQQRERFSDIDKQKETKSITELTDTSQPLTRQRFSDYLSLFGGRKNNFSESEDEGLELVSSKVL
ncbi:ubiquinone biosynthesis hydroxylase, UbiH/UbiF/VisC/COQ6 family [Legionella massiliensis]|uniref:Ubiquinone biosynthesis hydroxylase, UbiH/UbiF/VisC/COQ6 family n=1 Tax=Legionella massiliensis TaxID=1034943 RepID=A0A078KWA5_9GAMM|nr:hypothetical protein [Legionella massiliensis]CDZ76034.1 ubiquinone biosynthesis hydroxylase, UbiH/UbiF/VisC/COQ6 family [Legionella massiliensis]CEE11772.1 Kynurenine 3-monooxygenase [Legionella massiliensis]